MVFGDGTDADVVAFADDELEAAVQVFHVRGGRVRGQRGWIVEKSGEPGESGQGAIWSSSSSPSSTGTRPNWTVRPTSRQPGAASGAGAGACRDNAEELATWLSQLRGSRVALRVPMRGDKRALAETVKRNAQDALAQHKLKRAGDFTARSAALQSIQDALGLADAPLRIECVDISHVQGTDVVASLVVFEDGLPRKSDYRHYAIREAAGEGRSDDVASIAEVTRRRFARHRIRSAEHQRAYRRKGNRASSPIRRTSSSSTAAPHRSTRRRRFSTSSASPTSPSSGWPSGWKRCGCRRSPTR